MPMTVRCELMPDPAVIRNFEAVRIPYRAPMRGAAPMPDLVIGPILRIHDQGSLPSCAGQATAACLEPDTGEALSGIEGWRESLRRLGRRVTADTGTYLYAVGDAVCERGSVPWRAGEDLDHVWALRSLDRPGLDTELDATVRRLPARQRVRIDEHGERRIEALATALASGVHVCAGGPVTERFVDRRADGADAVAGLDEVWNDRDSIGGHAMRVAGYARLADGNVRWLLQNSWGEWWGGAWLPWRPEFTPPSVARAESGGWFLPGCCWVSSEVIASSDAWDFHGYSGCFDAR